MPPLLVGRCPDPSVVERILGQHADVKHRVATSQLWLERWTTGDAAAAQPVTENLTALIEPLNRHLDDEEQQLVPLCADDLSPEEWGQVPAHGMKNFAGDKLWLILGLIRDRPDRTTQEQRDTMLAYMPPPFAAMWTEQGESAYKGLMEEIGAPLA